MLYASFLHDTIFTSNRPNGCAFFIIFLAPKALSRMDTVFVSYVQLLHAQGGLPHHPQPSLYTEA